MKHFIMSCCGAALLASSSAQAHYLWIESGNDNARLYFGEAEGLLKEMSPGKLDKIKAPKAFVQQAVNGNPGAVALSRGAEYFSIAGKGSAILASEETLEASDLSKYGLGMAKSNYYARYGSAAASGSSPLALDVQERGANTFVVSYHGQPLKDAKLEVIAPNTWIQEHKTDAQGVVHINTPWRGQYVMHLLHVDKTPGEFAGNKYDALRNHFTYTFVKAEGADPGPAVPPSHGAD